MARRKSTKELLKKIKTRPNDVVLCLDSYDDIFSDFDPRHNSHRALSQDFLGEAERASRDKIKNVGLKLLVPAKKRNQKEELVIKRRLSDHFRKHYKLLHKETKGVLREGIVFVFIGLFLMLAAAFTLFEFRDESLIKNFLIVMLEPGGWFLFWEGLNLVLFESKVNKNNLEFHRKMIGSDISFYSY